MNVINKIAINCILVGVFMSFFSCRTVSIVDFESEGYERFKVGKTASQDLPDEFYAERAIQKN